MEKTASSSTFGYIWQYPIKCFILQAGGSFSNRREESCKSFTSSSLKHPQPCGKGSWWRDEGGAMRWTRLIRWGPSQILRILPTSPQFQIPGCPSRTKLAPSPKRPSARVTTPCGCCSPTGLSAPSKLTLLTGRIRTEIPDSLWIGGGAALSACSGQRLRAPGSNQMNQAEQFRESLATSDIIRARLDPCPAVL